MRMVNRPSFKKEPARTGFCSNQQGQAERPRNTKTKMNNNDRFEHQETIAITTEKNQQCLNDFKNDGFLARKTVTKKVKKGKPSMNKSSQFQHVNFQ